MKEKARKGKPVKLDQKKKFVYHLRGTKRMKSYLPER